MNFNYNYLINKSDISSEMKTGLFDNFKNKQIESQYVLFIIQREKSKNLIMTVTIFLFFLANILNVNNNHPTLSFEIIQICCMIVDLTISVVSFFFITNRKVIIITKYFRSIAFYYLSFFYSLMVISQECEDLVNLQGIQTLILISFINTFYYHDYNLVIIILHFCSNFLILIVFQIHLINKSIEFKIFNEYFMVFINLIITIQFKRDESEKLMNLFINNFKSDKIVDYFNQYLNSISTTYTLTINSAHILHMNRFFLNFLNKLRSHMTTSLFNEDENLLKIQNADQDPEFIKQNQEICNLFLKNCQMIEHNHQYKNNSLLEISKELISSNSDLEKDNLMEFKRIGDFYCLKSKNKPEFFEIFYKKVNIDGKILLDLLIYNITKIKLVEKIKAESKYKQKLLTKITHEFKNPLNSIISYITKIKDQISDNDTKTQECLDSINNLSNFLIFLIKDIVIYSNDNSGDINISKFDIKETMLFCKDILKTLIDSNETKKKLIKPILKLGDDIENFEFESDENSIKQILINFITNSIKFTFTGYIKIKAKLVKEQLKLSVKDTGVGIKSDHNLKIDTQNFLLDNPNRQNSIVNKVGLTICKKLCEKLRIEINFKSTKNGSEFYIIIPHLDSQKKARTFISSVNRSHEIERKSMRINDKEIKKNIFSPKKLEKQAFDTFFDMKTLNDVSDGHFILEKRTVNEILLGKKEIYCPDEMGFEQFEFQIYPKFRYINNHKNKILIVDDVRIIRENTVKMVEKILFELHLDTICEVIEGSDGVDLITNAVKDTHNHRIKLILTDETMEYLNGSEAITILRNLHKMNKIQNILIVSVTSFEDEYTKKNLIEAGANQVITKPCTKTELQKLIKSILT